MTSTSVDILQWYDSASLIRVQLAELVALETLRTYHVGDTTVTVRKLQASQTVEDTLSAASSSLRSEVAAETTQIDEERPLTAQSIQRGVAWRRTLILVGCLIFLALFLWFDANMKKN